MTKQEQIEIMYQEFLSYRFNTGADKFSYKSMCENFISKGYRKLPKDSVVLTKEEYEMLANQYKNLEIKYSNLSDNYRLCKDANEVLKHNVVTIRKETAKEYHNKFAEVIQERDCVEGYAEIGMNEENDEILKSFGLKVE